MNSFNEFWAAMLKMALKQAGAITDDQEALSVQCLYNEWNKQIGKQLNVGEYIQHEGNMELFNGKYYIQNEAVYLCTRDSGAPLYHDLSSLVGIYVEEVK